MWVRVFIILMAICMTSSRADDFYASPSSSLLSRNNTENCPPWYIPDSERAHDECSYSDQLPQILRAFNGTTELLLGYCMTVAGSRQIVSQCPYIQDSFNSSHVNQLHSVYRVLAHDADEVNSTLCSPFHRKGFLCSECEEGYGLAVFRYYGLICKKCSNSTYWPVFWYIVLETVPSTLFFVFMIVFRVNINSGSLTGFVFFSNVIINTIYFYPALLMLPQLYWQKSFLFTSIALYNLWSLEFLQFLIPPFCVSENITSLQLVSLGSISAIFPLFLCVLTYVFIELHARGVWLIVKLWNPLQKLLLRVQKPWNIRSSVVHTFATFLLLSYAKISFICFTLLQSFQPVSLDIKTGKLSTLSVHSIDLSTEYFSKSHAPYGALGLIVCLLLIILPLFLILLYPTRLFPKLARCLSQRKLQAIRTFMEVFQGCYKDGVSDTNTKDYRLVSGIYLFARIAIGAGTAKLSSRSTEVQSYDWLITASCFVLGSIFFAFFKPYRKRMHNIIDVIILLWIAKMCINNHILLEMDISGGDLKVMIAVTMFDFMAPQVILVLYLSYKVMLVLKKQIKKLIESKRVTCLRNFADDPELNLEEDSNPLM